MQRGPVTDTFPLDGDCALRYQEAFREPGARTVAPDPAQEGIPIRVDDLRTPAVMAEEN